MPRKKQNTQKSFAPDALYNTLFKLIEKEGWHGLTLPRIARAAKIKLADLLVFYTDKNALLAGFGAFLDKVLANRNAEPVDASLKERLFDVLMQRFELLNQWRGGLIRLLDDMGQHPVTALCFGLEAGPAFCRSMQVMLQLAGVPVESPRGKVATFLLKLVYFDVVRVWRRDESRDLSATMAALDRALDKFLRLNRL